MDDTQANLIHFMPNGKPAPAVLTSGEVIELLRLEGKNPERTLKYWRDEGELVGIPLGKRIRYRLEDVLSFVAKKAEKTLQRQCPPSVPTRGRPNEIFYHCDR